MSETSGSRGSPSDDPPRRVAVIGAGIAGLTAAWRIRQRDPAVDVHVFESRDRVGGVLRSERRDDYLVEHSGDMFTSKDPWAIELCRELGIEEQLVSADDARRRAYVVRKGRLLPVPQGFVLMRPTQFASILSTPILSLPGKLRLACEPFIPARRDESDESLQSFVTRRLGRETFERIVQPLIGGIYTADPTKLSMAATMPNFVEMERQYGSLIRAPHKASDRQSSGARYGTFVAPREGMQSLALQLASRLPTDAIHLNAPVQSLVQSLSASPAANEGRWQLEVDGQPRPFDGVVLACGAPAASKLLRQAAPRLSDELSEIPYASAAVAILGVRAEQIERPPAGFGFVVPMIERRRILAVSFASFKFPGRAADDRVLLRVFIGGACQAELLDRDDDELLRIAQEELQSLIGFQGEPELTDVIRWNRCMPQYHVGHLDRVQRIESLLEDAPTLQLAGNALRGVGVPFCIHSGNQAAENLLRRFSRQNQS